MLQPSRKTVVEPGCIVFDDPDQCVTFKVSGNCPVQGFGTVLGRDLYFRARDNKWSFEVADHKGELPSDGRAESDGFYRESNFPKASWMSNEEAVRIILRCLEEYLGIRIYL